MRINQCGMDSLSNKTLNSVFCIIVHLSYNAVNKRIDKLKGCRIIFLAMIKEDMMMMTLGGPNLHALFGYLVCLYDRCLRLF